jgi:hypothetical protein
MRRGEPLTALKAEVLQALVLQVLDVLDRALRGSAEVAAGASGSDEAVRGASGCPQPGAVDAGDVRGGQASGAPRGGPWAGQRRSLGLLAGSSPHRPQVRRTGRDRRGLTYNRSADQKA